MLTFSWDRSYVPAQSGPFLSNEEPAAQDRQVQHSSPRGRQPCPGHTKGRSPHTGTQPPAVMAPALPWPGPSSLRSSPTTQCVSCGVCVCVHVCGLSYSRPFWPSAHHLTHRISTLGCPSIAGIKVPPAPESFRPPEAPVVCPAAQLVVCPAAQPGPRGRSP